MKDKISNLARFVKVDIWRIRQNTLKGPRSFWIRQLRIILLAVRGYNEDKCQLRASALTFYSLLSVVPVVAMAFGIAKGFGMEKLLEKRLIENLKGQEEVASQIIGFANSFLENTQGGVIAGIGIVVLFWTVIKVLGQIENSFNDIWGIKKSRTFGRKFSDYLSIMLICPVLLIMSGSITVAVTSFAHQILDKLSFLGPVAPLILQAVDLVSYAFIWGVFTFVYVFMPNTNVKIKSAFLAGIVAGTVYKAVQWAYIAFQLGASKYGAIYGSFAALPLFLIWLQVSWLIVLFGAEVSFAEQNVETYEFEPDCLEASKSFKKLTALYITHLCISNFREAQNPWKVDQISEKLEIPIRLARQILYDLTEAGVLIEVKDNKDKSEGYQPAFDIDDMTISKVIQLLETKGKTDIPLVQSKAYDKIKNSLNNFSALVEKSPENLLLKNL